MIVFSPLSLYTTYLGWQVYDLIFEAFYQTGLWYLGFGFVVFRYFKNAFAPGGATHHAGEHALNHFMYELAVLIIVCSVFIYPTVPLSASELKFTPMCTTEVEESTAANNSGTTYDEAFYSLLSPEVKIPLGFSVLQNFVSSLTYALMTVTPCVDGLNNIKSDIVSIHLPRKLRQEVTDFQKQCFMEARLKFTTEKPEESSYAATLKMYGGESDVKWVGSHVLRELYYPNLKAREPVSRYPYSQFRNVNLDKAKNEGEVTQEHLPKYGFPDCETWWVDIRQSLVDLTEDKGFINDKAENRAVYLRILNLLQGANIAGKQDAPDDELAHDLIAKTLIQNNDDIGNRRGTLTSDNNGVQRFAATWLNRAGMAVKSWTYTPLKREAIVQTAPVMQALAMFFVIVLLPIVVGISGCNPRAVGAFCGVITVLILTHFLWFLVGMLEMKLLETLEGNGELISIIQNTAVMFYFIAPAILVGLSAHWGAGAGNSLAQLGNNAEKEAESSAKSGADVAKEGAKATGKALL